MAGNITVSGIAEVQKMLREAPREIVGSAFTKALSASANVVADAVAAGCPEKAEDTGGLLDKGMLRESVSVRVALDSQLRGGTGEVYFRGVAAQVALWIEYGHKIVGHSGKQFGQTRPRPFVRRAFESSANNAIAAFCDAMVGTLQDGK